MPPVNSIFLKGVIQETLPTDEQIAPYELHINPTTGAMKLRKAGDDAFLDLGGGASSVPLTSGEFVTNGLVAGYKFTENAGQVLNDFSGNAFHGQLGSAPGIDANDPSWLTPRGLIFTPAGPSYVQIPAAAAFRLTGVLSVEAQFKWMDVTNGAIFDKTGGDVTNKNYQLHIAATGAITWRLVKGTVNQDLVGPLITVGAMYHVLCTYDGSQGAVWVDGVKSITRNIAAAPIDNVDGICRIGSLGGSVFPLTGIIYKLAVYNKALSPTEISAAFLASKGDGVIS